MKTEYKSILITLLLIVSTCFPVLAQDEVAAAETREVDMTLAYVKKTDGLFHLTAAISAETDKEFAPVPGLMVHFYCVTDSGNALLGSLETNVEGKAPFIVPADMKVFRDTGGAMTFIAEFEGSELYAANSAEFIAKDIRIEISLEEADSVRNLHIQAFAIKGNGEEVPLHEQDIFIYVQGIYSKLQVADGWLENGECYVEFPKNIPGDRNGKLTIYAGYIEHPDFANVEKAIEANWGIIPDYLFEGDGQLWSNIAPTWMIILLFVLLTGVWGHYVYAMVQLRKIYKLGKKKAV